MIKSHCNSYTKYIASNSYKESNRSSVKNYSSRVQTYIESEKKKAEEKRAEEIQRIQDEATTKTLQREAQKLRLETDNKFDVLYHHAKCTDKVKACARCKYLEERKKNESATSKSQERMNELKHLHLGVDLLDQKKKELALNGSTLFFKDSVYKPLEYLDAIVERDYSTLLLVLSFLLPELFIDLLPKKEWRSKSVFRPNLFTLKYEDVIVMREDIEFLPKYVKLKFLYQVIKKFDLKVFQKDYNISGEDPEEPDIESSDSGEDQDYFEEKYEELSEFFKNSSVFYFTLLHKLFTSKYNCLNLDDQEISFMEETKEEVSGTPKKRCLTDYQGLVTSNITMSNCMMNQKQLQKPLTTIRQEKAFYQLEMDQSLIDRINESTSSQCNFNNETIEKICKVFTYLADNPESYSQLYQLAVDQSTQV
ncbi:unnamed protein product [Moneuplotes crassus]|uniref:Uncharacterized protein n=1 Tax=Euplotes crassus TaxID=5936 RepID=A0AAD2DAT6_EUPCR|nr:unnamed protein product [Moneuplotes crassus]